MGVVINLDVSCSEVGVPGSTASMNGKGNEADCATNNKIEPDTEERIVFNYQK